MTPVTSEVAACRLESIVKAYDVRGLVGEQLTPAVAEAMGWAFGRFIYDEADDPTEPRNSAVVIGHDMRASSPGLAAAFAEGVTAAGLDVVLLGLASTDLMYFASGTLDLPGAMFTASHNPARYNGIKLCMSGAAPLSLDTGLARVRDLAQAMLDGTIHRPALPLGAVTERSLLAEYADYLNGLVDLSWIRQLHVVVDAGNGMAGYTVPAVLTNSRVSVSRMYFELDGTFPNHEANPLEPANLVDLQAAVRRVGADLGLAFDGDADRCFVIDERGRPVSPSAITALVASRELARRPGSTVLYNAICSRAVPQIISEAGGRAVRTRVGHSFIKAEMAATGAVFGGEHSAHYYFADFFYADTGMLAALHVLAALGGQERPLSELAAEFERYSASGEINTSVGDVPATLDRVRTWATDNGGSIDELDGVEVRLADQRWFNVRPSNTEPLLRLNVEAATAHEMGLLRDEVLDLIRG